jgi:hypothetical protein
MRLLYHNGCFKNAIVHFSFTQQWCVAGLLFVVVQGCCGSLWCGYCPEWNTSGSTINYATLTTTNQFANASAFDHKTGVFQVIKNFLQTQEKVALCGCHTTEVLNEMPPPPTHRTF